MRIGYAWPNNSASPQLMDSKSLRVTQNAYFPLFNTYQAIFISEILLTTAGIYASCQTHGLTQACKDRWTDRRTSLSTYLDTLK